MRTPESMIRCAPLLLAWLAGTACSSPAPAPSEAPAWRARYERLVEVADSEFAFCAWYRDPARRAERTRDRRSALERVVRSHYLLERLDHGGAVGEGELEDLERGRRGVEPLLEGECFPELCLAHADP